MPREFVILSPQPVDMQSVVAAAQACDPTLSLRMLEADLIAQFYTPTNDPLLTFLHPRLVTDPNEIARLLPQSTRQRPTEAEPDATKTLWWTDLFTPWGRAEPAAVALATALANRLDGVLADPMG
jgi:hypothetical protein